MAYMVRLYKWSRLNEVIDTQYGRITVKEWLEREKDRITSDPSRQAEVRISGGIGTLIVDRPKNLKSVFSVALNGLGK